MEADYLQAALPEPVVILGQVLKPFSLGHRKILLSKDNAFVRGTDPTLGDLIFAVFVCCQTYEECLDSFDRGVLLPQPWLHRFLRVEPKRMRLDQWLYEWGKLFDKIDVKAEMAAFAEYIAKGSLRAREHANDPGASMGTCYIQSVQIVLTGKLGHSLSEALNKPWGEAMQDYQAFWEMEGRIKLFSPEDEAHLRAVRELEAEILKEQQTNA
jgi:hypothetical protein